MIDIVPLIISGYLCSQRTNTSLTEASFDKLTGIRKIKKKEIEKNFHERKTYQRL